MPSADFATVVVVEMVFGLTGDEAGLKKLAMEDCDIVLDTLRAARRLLSMQRLSL